MRVIYEPKGRAKEYAELAFNTYIGCRNACRYCYAPSCMKKTRDEYHAKVEPRTEQVLRKFVSDCQEMKAKGDVRRVHMNFVSDPYPDEEATLKVTRRCLEAAAENGVKINLLTKGKYDLVARDFDLMQQAGVHLGVTCSFWFDKDAREWEPNAENVANRIRILNDAHKRGIFTWVSMEPVVIPYQALMFFKYCNDLGIVGLWKVGKLNYHEHAKTIDWVRFRDDLDELSGHYVAPVVIKKSLLEAK